MANPGRYLAFGVVLAKNLRQKHKAPVKSEGFVVFCQSAEAATPSSLVGVRTRRATLAIGVGDYDVYGSRLGGRRNGSVDIAASRGLNRRLRGPHKDLGPEYEVRSVDGNAATSSNASRTRSDAANTRWWRRAVGEAACQSAGLAIHVLDYDIGRSQRVGWSNCSDRVAVQHDDRVAEYATHGDNCAAVEALTLNHNGSTAIDRTTGGRD